MSSNSSLSLPATNSIGQLVSEKLCRENYILWKAQVLATMRGAHLYEFLDGTSKAPDEMIQVAQPDKTMKEEVNPAYAAWYAQDQQLLSFLLNSVTKEVLGQVAAETLSQERGVQSWGCLRHNPM
jgi:hypothetical protein